MRTTIGILMATYNGAAHLDAQLQSLSDQSHKDWHLYVRDDGSSDKTPDIIAAFSHRHPGQVTVLCDGHGRLGARGNFARLMGQAADPYIAFCDQDDVWRSDRLTRTLGRMRALEGTLAHGTPCLVHADRRIIDQTGHERAPSYWASRGLSPRDFTGLESHYAFSLAAGSTMLLNRALLELARPVPSAARMYDCWVELIAHAFGAVAWVDGPLVDHRRHGANTTGAVSDIDSAPMRRPLARARRLLSNLDRQRAIYAAYFDQTAALYARHGADLPVGERAFLETFLALPERWFPARLRLLKQIGAAPPGHLRLFVIAWLCGSVAPPLAHPWPDTLSTAPGDP